MLAGAAGEGGERQLPVQMLRHLLPLGAERILPEQDLQRVEFPRTLADRRRRAGRRLDLSQLEAGPWSAASAARSSSRTVAESPPSARNDQVACLPFEPGARPPMRADRLRPKVVSTNRRRVCTEEVAQAGGDAARRRKRVLTDVAPRVLLSETDHSVERNEAVTEISDPNSPITKAVRLLSLVARKSAPLALAEMAAELDLPKPTVHRIAAQLEAEHWLYKDPFTRRYAVGDSLRRLCLAALQGGASQQSRQLPLRRLSEKLGETVNLGVLAGTELLYLERVECSWPLRTDFKPGTRVPLHCTANGKLLLAFAPRDAQQRLLSAMSLDRHTETTITDRAALEREFAKIRRRGYSVDDEEFHAGVCCLAVPVRGEDARVVAGVAVAAPTARFPLEKARAHLPDLRQCADEIARYVP